MSPAERLLAIKAEAKALKLKAETNPETFTEADATRASEISKEHTKLTEQIERSQAAGNALREAGAGTSTQKNDHPGNRGGFGGFQPGSKPLGQTEKTQGYTAAVMKAMEQAAPSIGGPSVQKALVPSGAVTADFDGRVVNDPRATFSVTAAVNGRQVDSPSGTYLRQTLRENNATTVQSGTLKPISKYGMEPQTWTMATIAHLSEPIKKQWLEDYGAFEQFLSQELAYGVDAAIAAFILEGGISEDGGTITGILNTSGIVQTAFVTNKLRTIRKSIGELEAVGIEPSGILMAPEDWEEIETLTITSGEYLLNGAPQKSVDRVLWNIPVTLVQNMTPGEAVVGDLSTVSLLFRNSQQLSWTEAMTETGTLAVPAPRDLFRNNEVVFRNEIRVGLEILSLKALRVASLTA